MNSASPDRREPSARSRASTGIRRRRRLQMRLLRRAAVRFEHKFDSGTGWPSFFAPLSSDAVETDVDDSHFMRRTEIHCAKCGCHLGTYSTMDRSRPVNAIASTRRRYGSKP
jgi:hypothetical protein